MRSDFWGDAVKEFARVYDTSPPDRAELPAVIMELHRARAGLT
jgi:hypothetical protein